MTKRQISPATRQIIDTLVSDPRWSIAWKTIYLAVFSSAIFLTLADWAYDDPYITYRYAENLYQHRTFVYNMGERVLSTTTPLFALLLAGLKGIYPNLPRLSVLVGAFSLAVGGLFIWELGQTWKAPLAGLVGLLLYPSFPLLTLTLGSEIPLYLALGLGAFWTYAKGQYRGAAFFSALAVLTRADGVLVALILVIDYFLRRRGPAPVPALGIFFGITTAWFGFAWLYFGSPFPATLAAKQYQGAMAISQRFPLGIGRILEWYSPLWQFRFQAILAFFGMVYALWQARAWTLLLVWAPVYTLGYAVLGVSSYFWYYAALVPAFVAAAGLGIQGPFRELSSGWVNLNAALQRRFSSLPLLPGRVVAGALVVSLLIPMSIAQARVIQNQMLFADQRVKIYQAAGNWLQASTPASATVGALEVGIIGYHAQRTMIDFAGLIQPPVASQLTETTTYEDAALWAAQNYLLDYLVLVDGQLPRLQAGYAATNCQVVEQFSGEAYQFSQDLLIYACSGT